MRQRALALTLLGAGLLLAGPARAGKTYCVGGLEKGLLRILDRHQCADLASVHRPWHFHSYVRGKVDGKCYSCFDEQDDTCDTLMPREQPFVRVGYEVCQDPAPIDSTTMVYVPDPGPGAPPEQARKPVPAPKPPPAPKPVDFTGVIVRTSPGPYAVGDSLTIEGAVEGADGRRDLAGGQFVLVGPDGAQLPGSPVRATATKTGTVSAEIKLARAGAVAIRFEPQGIFLRSNEKLGKVTPAVTSLTASNCRLRGQVTAPAAGELVVASAPMNLKGTIRNSAGQPVGAADLGGAQPVFVVEVAGQAKKAPATFTGTDLTATLALPPPAAGSEALVVRLIGEGGAGDLCPDPAVNARLTALGLDLTTRLPADCYVGRPCAVEVSFDLPRDPTARAAGEAFLKANPTVTAKVNEKAFPGPLRAQPGDPAGRHTGSFTPDVDGTFDLEVSARAGSTEVQGRLQIRIRNPIALALPEELDLGVVRAGTAWADTCKVLDFSRSQGVVDQPFELLATRPQGCDSAPVVKDQGLGYPVTEPLKIEIPRDRKLPLCLANVPFCASEAPAPIVLTVRALSPDFPDQKRQVRLRWRVEGKSFLACHWWWLVIAGGVLSIIMIGYGWVRPDRFASDDQVKLAGKREQLARAVARRLLDLPGGRPGWYRSSATGLREDGSATDKLRTAAVELHARRGEVILKSRGGLQRVSPQTKKLEPVADAGPGQDGHIASRNVTYNVGTLYFQLH